MLSVIGFLWANNCYKFSTFSDGPSIDISASTIMMDFFVGPGMFTYDFFFHVITEKVPLIFLLSFLCAIQVNQIYNCDKYL